MTKLIHPARRTALPFPGSPRRQTLSVHLSMCRPFPTLVVATGMRFIEFFTTNIRDQDTRRA
jgi:hypothetical protein